LNIEERSFQLEILEGIPDHLPAARTPSEHISHAPVRDLSGVLDEDEKILAVENALRYFDPKFHETLAPEFLAELKRYGRIYMYRFMPRNPIKSRPIWEYPANCQAGAAIMLMIQNNLDTTIAKHPEELITYGGNGAVFQNWAQYRLTMYYLSQMTEEQTLVLYSGHPMGLFPSAPGAPRVVVTNGLMIPNYSSKQDWNKYNALGVTQYGQMTAGSFMYIGPQGIVHGTTITLMNAGRKLGFGSDLHGKLFVTSGLGGMSGAQSIAGKISGCVTLIAETDQEAIEQRITDGYIDASLVFSDLNTLVSKTEEFRKNKIANTLVYAGNVVDLWEYLAAANIKVELGSDQTSLHNIDDLGYTPVGYTFAEAKQLMLTDKKKFRTAIEDSLQRQVTAINHLATQGMYFWDYGNAFLVEAGKAGADVWKDNSKREFKFPSYVEDIMGPLCFDLGFGPFRWVCMSGSRNDLIMTDKIASEVMEKLMADAPDYIREQLADNIKWIREAAENIPIVGSKSRILYANAEGRIAIASAFNQAIQDRRIEGSIVLGRDHHDVSGTDSPWRETANIKDGSAFTADMAIQNVIGDSFRGATWVSIHNGGGVGWGEVINGGFGMLLDGSEAAERKLRSMLQWDVYNGIARRAWARNPNAIKAVERAKELYPDMRLTKANLMDSSVRESLKNKLKQAGN